MGLNLINLDGATYPLTQLTPNLGQIDPQEHFLESFMHCEHLK